MYIPVLVNAEATTSFKAASKIPLQGHRHLENTEEPTGSKSNPSTDFSRDTSVNDLRNLFLLTVQEKAAEVTFKSPKITEVILTSFSHRKDAQ